MIEDLFSEDILWNKYVGFNVIKIVVVGEGDDKKFKFEFYKDELVEVELFVVEVVIELI